MQRSPRGANQRNESSPIVWQIIKNEEKNGANPYSMGYKDIAKETTERKRNISKERNISPIPFNSLVRTSKAMDDHMKVATLNRLHAQYKVQDMQKVRNISKAMELDITAEPNTVTIEEEEFKSRGNNTTKMKDTKETFIQISDSNQRLKQEDSRMSSVDKFDPNDSLYMPSRQGNQSNIRNENKGAAAYVKRNDTSDLSLNNMEENSVSNTVLDEKAVASGMMTLGQEVNPQRILVT